MSLRRLLHVSDVHFGGEDAAAAAATLAFAQREPSSVVVVTGDLTLNGLPREFEAAAAWMAALPRPQVATPGNHDTPYWNIPLRALDPFGRYRRWIGDPRQTRFDGAEVRVRSINTARGAQPRPDWSKGAIDLRACHAVVEDLGAGGFTGLRVVALHHPLIETPGAPVTGGVHRGAEAATILAQGGVDLILTGHVHLPFAVPLVAPDGRAYAVGAGTLSVRLRGAPASFNVVSWDDETTSVTAYGWTGQAFEPWRTWALPRRV